METFCYTLFEYKNEKRKIKGMIKIKNRENE